MHTRLAFAIVYPLLCIAESFIEKKKQKKTKKKKNGKLVRETWRSWEATKNNRQKQSMAGRAAMKLTVLTQN